MTFKIISLRYQVVGAGFQSISVNLNSDSDKSCCHNFNSGRCFKISGTQHNILLDVAQRKKRSFERFSQTGVFVQSCLGLVLEFFLQFFFIGPKKIGRHHPDIVPVVPYFPPSVLPETGRTSERCPQHEQDSAHITNPSSSGQSMDKIKLNQYFDNYQAFGSRFWRLNNHLY